MSVIVCALSPQHHSHAQCLASRLALPFCTKTPPPKTAQLMLTVSDQGLALQQGRMRVQVDFLRGKLAYRCRAGTKAPELIAKAVGLTHRWQPHVLDTTAGLGRDAFVLAALGCQVTLLERSQVITTLLEDGLQRATQHPNIAPIMARMQLIHTDAAHYLAAQPMQSVDVVYLDPMFCEPSSRALVKKDMQALQALLGEDHNHSDFLELAKQVARYRVVVKRARKAPDLFGHPPSYRLTGKVARFDIYAHRAPPKA